jgi:chaperone modulatory protein CbpM
MQRDKKLKIEQASQEAGVEKTVILDFVRRQWIVLSSPDELDEEDLARIHLIIELQDDFGVNEAAIPIILHLVDQLHGMRLAVTRTRGKAA